MLVAFIIKRLTADNKKQKGGCVGKKTGCGKLGIEVDQV